MIKITDSVLLSDTTTTDDGYLEAAVRVARTGIQRYAGWELGKPDIDFIDVYRCEEEVFSKASLETFSKLPVTDDHPSDGVNANNWRKLAVGVTGDDVLRDGEYLKVGLKLTDADIIQKVNNGKRELSVGYTTQIDFVDGVTPKGEAYQAVQRMIRANHVAVVDTGRCGPQARIGDSWTDFKTKSGNQPIKTGGRMPDLKTIVLGDKAVQVLDTDVAAIEQFKTESTKALADANTAISTKDEEIGKLTAELAQAKEAANIDVDALVANRSELVTQVKAIDAAIDPKGLTDAELRKAAVKSKLGDAVVDGVSDDVITGMYKAITLSAGESNSVRDAILGGVKANLGDAQKMNDALEKANDFNAWRNK